MDQEDFYVERINDLNRIDNSRQNGLGLANTQFAAASDPFGVSLCELGGFGTPVNWRILWNERNPPCELPVQHGEACHR
jgi:hypothetical protein